MKTTPDRIITEHYTETEVDVVGSTRRNAGLVRAALPLVFALGCAPAYSPDYSSHSPSSFTTERPLNVIHPVPCSKDILLQYAEKSPQSAFRAWDDCKGEPFLDEVIKKAAKIGAEKDPKAVFRVFPYAIIDKPYAREVLMKALNNTDDGNAIVLLIALPEYEKKILDLPYAEEVYTVLADKIPRNVLSGSSAFMHKPFASKVILRALKNTDDKRSLQSFLLLYIEEIMKLPNAEVILLKIAEKEPEYILQLSGAFKDQPYSESVIQRAKDNLKQ